MKNYKLIVSVFLNHADKVREATGATGGGQLGKYSFCSFSMKGTAAGTGPRPKQEKAFLLLHQAD